PVALGEARRLRVLAAGGGVGRGGADRVGGGAEVVRGDVRDGDRLAGRERHVLHGRGLVAACGVRGARGAAGGPRGAVAAGRGAGGGVVGGGLRDEGEGEVGAGVGAACEVVLVLGGGGVAVAEGDGAGVGVGGQGRHAPVVPHAPVSGRVAAVVARSRCGVR